MKNEILMLAAMLSASGVMTSCLSEEHDFSIPVESTETGTVMLNLDVDASFEVASRALNEAAYKNTSNYTVQIINTANNNVVLECKGSELLTQLPKTLDIGSYKVVAFYGKEQAASRNEFYMYGSSTFTIKAKDEKPVNVKCVPTCGKVRVSFDSEMATYYSDYSVSFGGTSSLGSNTFAWEKSDSDPWYVGVQENGEMLTYTIALTVKEDYLSKDNNGDTHETGTVTGTFKLDRNKAKNLTIHPNYTPTTEGGMKLSITIDESTNDHEVTYEVPVTWI